MSSALTNKTSLFSVVQKSAQGILSSEEVRSVLDTWEQQGHSSFSAFKLLRIINGKFRLSPEEKKLLSSRLYNLDVGDSSDSASDNSKAGDVSRETSPALSVFQQLFINLTAHPQLPVQLLQEQVHASTLSNLEKTYMIRAILREPDNTSLDYEQMVRIINTLYDAYCSFYGAVKTDQIYARAIKVTEAHPASIQFSPRRFL